MTATDHDGLPDLVTFLELVTNGTLKRRLEPLLTLSSHPTAIDRQMIVPEIEVGCSLLAISPAPSATATATTTTTLTRPTTESSLLLRAFRRQTTAAVVAPVALIGHTERLEDWASPKIVHIARTLEGLGFVFQFQMLVTRVTDGPTEDGRFAIHRAHTHLRGATTRSSREMKLKEKVRVPLSETDSSYLQIALEWPVEEDCNTDDPFLHAIKKGLLVSTAVRAATPHRTSVYVKCQWTGRCDRFPFEVSLRLAFNVETSHRMDGCRRPKNPGDVATWLAEVGCLGSADWNMEVELLQPTDLQSIGKALFFFQLLRRQHEGSINRLLLKTIVTRDCQHDPTVVQIQYARLLLQRVCTTAGIRCPDYPHQTRPHDFTLRDIERLPQTLVTPKVDGRECFLICHRTAAVFLHRNGEATIARWRDGSVGIFPLILLFSVYLPGPQREEGDWKTNGG